MCGIFGYLGVQEAFTMALRGIKKLDYRGYDSAGVAGFVDGKLCYEKKSGRVAVLEQIVEEKQWQAHVAIGQTRWATHGEPSDLNAHPHVDLQKKCAIVHNGIIENYAELKAFLEKEGICCVSESDSEVVAHLIAYFYKQDFLQAVLETIQRLKGSFALVCLHADHPNEIICASQESPLVLGIKEKEFFIASDLQAFIEHTQQACYLESGQVARLTINHLELFTTQATAIVPKIQMHEAKKERYNSTSFAHITLQEIHEQPYAAQALLDTTELLPDWLLQAKKVLLLGCGTSYHAAMIGSLWFQELNIYSQAAIASEWKYHGAYIEPDSVAIVISQSGETADTLAALDCLKQQGIKTLALCNRDHSTITRHADSTLLLHAGDEIAVASTKAFTNQVIMLLRLGLQIKQLSHHPVLEYLKLLPSQIQQILEKKEQLHAWVLNYLKADRFFYLGRRYGYPTALESALKLQELAYIHAQGYAAGELKHGPLALIDEEAITIAFCTDSTLQSKMQHSIMEIKARKGKVLAIAFEGDSCVCEELFYIPKTLDPIAVIPTALVGQLLAYYFALELGHDIDKPRNLAKSVTVE